MSNDKQDRDEKDDEMICALTADEHVALHDGLSGLPETMPPRDVWLRIREQAEAEGLVSQPAVRKHNRWYAGVGLAAAAVMAAVLMPGVQEPAGPSSAVPANTVTNTADLSNLVVLQAYSRQLESDLRALPDKPRVGRAGTIATMAGIEDRIAAIDYQLNDTAVDISDTDREIFWRERVRLMKLLLQLRYAQAQRAAF
jgi:hypothetical protein